MGQIRCVICGSISGEPHNAGCDFAGFVPPGTKETSDGSTAGYYELPEGATELQDIISADGMNSQIGEIFRACKRYGKVSHSSKMRDAKKILFYIQAEIERLEKYESDS